MRLTTGSGVAGLPPITSEHGLVVGSPLYEHRSVVTTVAERHQRTEAGTSSGPLVDVTLRGLWSVLRSTVARAVTTSIGRTTTALRLRTNRHSR
jgi:hypothetical protein